MIKDIPTGADFEAIGSALLNQAWGDLMSLLVDLQAAQEWLADSEIEGDESRVVAEEEYWRSATTRLSTILAIAHQSAEFYLKGRIADVSPFLLLSNSVREWPKADPSGDTSFSKLRTIDAQDIVRLHDRCSSSSLSDSFKSQLENLRIRRNSIMHTVDSGVAVKVNELIRSILAIHKNLVGGKWLDFRRASLDQSSGSKLYPDEDRWSDGHVVSEFLALESILSAAEFEEHFGLPAGRRRYICPQCTWETFSDSGVEVFSAVLEPNSPESKTIWCTLCDKVQPVYRLSCEDELCRGNVISGDWLKCATCAGRQVNHPD